MQPFAQWLAWWVVCQATCKAARNLLFHMVLFWVTLLVLQEVLKTIHLTTWSLFIPISWDEYYKYTKFNIFKFPKNSKKNFLLESALFPFGGTTTIRFSGALGSLDPARPVSARMGSAAEGLDQAAACFYSNGWLYEIRCLLYSWYLKI